MALEVINAITLHKISGAFLGSSPEEVTIISHTMYGGEHLLFGVYVRYGRYGTTLVFV